MAFTGDRIWQRIVTYCTWNHGLISGYSILVTDGPDANMELLGNYCGWFFIGCLICQRTSDDMKVHDHGSIVWDEFIGMWITLMAIPTVSWEWILTGFFIFRIFDMWKPWPIRWFDRRVSGGFGIMIDDVIAAIFAYVTVWLLAFYNLMPFSAN